MSEKILELKSCPFCRATPHRGPTRMITDQIHGEKIYRYKIWCPHGCATIDRPNEAMTIEDWNARAVSPSRIEEIAEHLYTKFCADPSIEWQDATEKLKNVWRRYAGEIAALSGENSK